MIRKPQEKKIVHFSIPSKDGILMHGECVIVAEGQIDPTPAGDPLRFTRTEFANILKQWRRHDPGARKLPKGQKINAMFLFLIRGAIARIAARPLD